mmetsp:Transcript_35338/g.64958  ORF Transcript_35338/g.64958 Transcript_35338/m.64958 type:complete len:95 (+) Transcript_35338:204-488(+)
MESEELEEDYFDKNGARARCSGGGKQTKIGVDNMAKLFTVEAISERLEEPESPKPCLRRWNCAMGKSRRSRMVTTPGAKVTAEPPPAKWTPIRR